VLEFSETVNASTLVASGITFKATGTSSAVTLTDGAVKSKQYSTSITYALVDNDVDRITALEDLATSASTTIVALAQGAVADMAGVKIQTTSETVRAGGYYSDATKPTLLSYTIDMNALVIVFEFSETINATSLENSLKSGKVTLQNTASTALRTSHHSLTGGTIAYSKTDSTRLNVTISDDDANSIKLLRGLAVATQNNTFLVLAAGTIDDMAHNGIAAFSAGSSSS
jgi:hypothetical protein